MEAKILYFEKPGRTNTLPTLQAARRRAEELKIVDIVVASTHGYTAKQAVQVFEGLEAVITAVSICAGYDDVGWTMTPAERMELVDLGVRVVTSMHALGDDVSEAFSGTAPNRIVRETLYRFCQGMKVAVEVALMAAAFSRLKSVPFEFI